jgi:two-component system response regulator
MTTGNLRNDTILLVEDNMDDEELTLLAFKACNLTNHVEVVRDGAEALEYLFCTGKHKDRDPGRMPQLILLDLKLPKIGGLDVLRRVRENPATQLLPVVVLTTSSEDEDIVSSYRLGANSYVRKPVEFSRFQEAIHQLGMYWLVFNEAPVQDPRGMKRDE